MRIYESSSAATVPAASKMRMIDEEQARESCCKDKQSVENRGLRSQDLDSYDGRSSRCPIDLVVLSQIVEDRRLSHFGRTHPQMLSNASHARHVMRRCSFQTACRHVRETMSMTGSVELVSSKEKDQSQYSIGLSFPFRKFSRSLPRKVRGSHTCLAASMPAVQHDERALFPRSPLPGTPL